MSQIVTGLTADGTLYFEAAGEGEVIVLVHAGFVDSRMWDDQWEDFTRRYRTIRYDIRGYGKSGPADDSTSRRDDLYNLLTELQVERAHLLGCSLGGEIILDFALENPEMVSSLVLVSTVPGGFEMQGEPPPTLLEMIAASQQGDVSRAADLQVRLLVDGPFRPPEAVDPRVRRRAAEMSQDAHTRGASPDAEVRPLNPPARQRLHELQAPTLIVVGALDDPEILRAAHVMTKEIKGAQLVAIPESAHMPSMERPDQFNRIVTDFVDSIR